MIRLSVFCICGRGIWGSPVAGDVVDEVLNSISEVRLRCELRFGVERWGGHVYANWRSNPGPQIPRDKFGVWCNVPFDARVARSSKNPVSYPNCFETGDHFLSFLFVSFMPEQLLISFHGAIDSISPCFPEDRAQVKLVILEGMCNLMAPYGPKKLSTENIPPRGFSINCKCCGRVPSQFLFYTRTRRVRHDATTNIFTLLRFRNSVQACVISEQSRNACCRVSRSCAGQIWHVLGKPIRSLHAPTGRPSVRTNHCMAETLRGR